MSSPDESTPGVRRIAPTDRNRLPPTAPGEVKSTRYPRTDRRMQRIEGVLARRQTTLTVVLEDVHDQHNASAVLRSCDAVGVLDVHLVYLNDPPPRRAFHRTTSGSAAKWIRTRFHSSIDECYAALRDAGHRIYATALREGTHDLYELDLTLSTALVFGNERRGVSERAIDLADGTVSIPMQGMVESLNISVACGVSLFEAMRQRRRAGMYEHPQLDAGMLRELLDGWVSK